MYPILTWECPINWCWELRTIPDGFLEGEKSTSEGGSGTVRGRVSLSGLGLARLGLAWHGLAQIGAARPSLAKFGLGPARPISDLDRLGLVRSSSARFGLPWLGSVWLCLTQPSPAQIGSGQLDSRRSEDVPIFVPPCFRMVGGKVKSV